MRRILALVIACSAVPGALASQTVAGTLVANGGAPLAGATVTLLDEQGRPVAAASSRANGGFTLTAPAAGRYRVRADRVGHASTTSAPIALAAGETFSLRLEAVSRGVQLEGIKATAGDRGCVVNPRAGARTAAVWDEARKVLSATRLSERSASALYTIRRFRRELDATTSMTRGAREDTTRGRSLVPFRSLPPEELARDGYVRREGRENVFFAPDAQVLLSDEFLDGHCFRVVPGSGPSAGMIGLAFEPVRGRRLPDVEGTLWLDPASAELRFMEFAYTGLDGISPDGGDWGGTVEFDQTDAGMWIVNRWKLRLPVVGRMTNPRGRSVADARVGVIGISEVGAEVLGVGTALATGVVAGTVFDSTRARPLAGAVVRLAGTGHSATTDASGAFRMGEVPAGRYAVEFTHPRADSLQWKPAAAEVAVASGESAVHLSLPRRAAPVVIAGRDTMRVVQLEGVTGTAAAQTRTLTRLGFYERKERGFGTQWTGDEFRDRGRGRITDHITGTKRIFARPTGEDDGITFLRSQLGLTCWVPVFLDARRVPAKELNRLRREDIVAVEIYEGTDVPGEFNIAAHYNSSGRRRACGAIVVWTTLAR